MKHLITPFLFLWALNVQAFDFRQLGDLEVLNDVGLSQTREAIKVFDRTLTVLGVAKTGDQSAMPRTNRGIGHARKVYDRNTNRKIRLQDVPIIVRDVQDLIIYLPRD
jgi:hypothetical protein